MRWQPLAVALVAAAVGFLFEGNGPVGAMIWPPADGPEPEGAVLGLLVVMGVLEALAFGVGVAFLVFGYPWIRNLAGSSAGYALAVYLSVAWLLVNWVPHTALHMNHGNIEVASDFAGLAAIEYGFHLTLIVAGCLIAHFFLRVARGATRGAPEVA